MVSRDVASAEASAESARQSQLEPRAPSKETRSGAVQLSASAAAPVQRSAGRAAAEGAGDWEMTPGLSTALGLAAPVQRAASGEVASEAASEAGSAGGDVQAIAQRGVAGASSALPHAAEISRSFGHHDISDIRTATGGEAGDASRAIGAQAYATGSSIAFAEAPSLHLAAHEAAHVVQQRAGVHLSGGVGRSGDLYEQHADAVADLVVRGESAQGLLDEHTGGPRAAGAGVQRAVQRVEDPPLGGEPPVAAADPQWDPFAAALRAEVQPEVLAVFGGATGATGAHLRTLFTAEQRDKLTAFFTSRVIPERLFNDGDGAGTTAITARQRVMLSAHILSVGTYLNQDAEQQRVEARNCGHWVTLVNAYAGMGSENATDVRGNFDHRGDVVLHAGATGRPSHSPSAGNLPMSEFDSIQPGDWLYIHGAINHSVVFAQWTDTSPRSVAHGGDTYRYRRAITYDQLHNGDGEGGLRHTDVRLGDRQLSRSAGAPMTIYPITRVEAPQETSVATTVEDLLPNGADLADAAVANRAGLEANHLTLETAIAWVREQNAALITTVAAPRAAGTRESRVSPAQLALLQQANAQPELEPLVHLNERLQRLADGVAFLERSEAADTAQAYDTDAPGAASGRAAGGFHTSSGRISGSDESREPETTGLLEQLRAALPGYDVRVARRAATAARRRGGRGGGGSGAAATPSAPTSDTSCTE